MRKRRPHADHRSRLRARLRDVQLTAGDVRLVIVAGRLVLLSWPLGFGASVALVPTDYGLAIALWTAAATPARRLAQWLGIGAPARRPDALTPAARTGESRRRRPRRLRRTIDERPRPPRGDGRHELRRMSPPRYGPRP